MNVQTSPVCAKCSVPKTAGSPNPNPSAIEHSAAAVTMAQRQGWLDESCRGRVLVLFESSSGIGQHLDLGLPHRPDEDGEDEPGEAIRAPQPARGQLRPAARRGLEGDPEVTRD